MMTGAIGTGADQFAVPSPPQSRPADSAAKQAQQSRPVSTDKDMALPLSTYRKDGTLAVPLYKTYGQDGKVQVYYQNKAPEKAAPVADIDQASVPAARQGSGPSVPIYQTYGPDSRGRLYYPGEAAAKPATAVQDKGGKSLDTENTAGCNTCSSRSYQDKSNDPGVSFKLGGHASAAASVAAVFAHERQHETRETRDARENGGEVVFTNVRVHMQQCPECKRMYAAGGVTEVQKIRKQSLDYNG